MRASVLRFVVAAGLCAPLAFFAACSSEDKPPPIDGTCVGPACLPGTVDAGSPTGQVGDADTYKGERGSVRGAVSSMRANAFNPYRKNADDLAFPATLEVPAYKFNYRGRYVPEAGIQLNDVPVGNDWFVRVRDEEGKNGIVDSVIGVGVTASTYWEIPVTKRADLETIYAANGLTLKADKAQMIFTLTEGPQGSEDVQPDVVVSLGAPAEAILYDTPTGFAPGAKTGAGGTAILVNFDAPDYPGTIANVTYTFRGKTYTWLRQHIVKGATTRTYVFHQEI